MDNNFNNQNGDFNFSQPTYSYQPVTEQPMQNDTTQTYSGQPSDNQGFGQSTYTNQSYDAQNYNNSTYGNQPYQSESYYNYQPNVQPPVVENGSKALAIISLVCGIISIVMMCCSFLSLICGIVAIVLAVVYKSKTVYKKFDGMSLAGLICGIIGALASGMFVLITLLGSVMNIASY